MKTSDNRISAFTPPPQGVISAVKDGIVYQTKKTRDFRNLYRYLQYKKCGFDEIIFSGEDKYLGEDFKSSQLKKMLDLAKLCNLKAIVFDERIIGITTKCNKCVVGEMFDSMDSLIQFVKNCFKDYSKHKAFFGVSIIDEPRIDKLKIISELAYAIRQVKSDTFIHTCYTPIMPLFGGALFKDYFGADDDPWKNYSDYVGRYCLKDIGYFGFDIYPFKFWDGVDIVQNHIKNLQVVANNCRENNIPFHLTIQSYADDKVDSNGNKRNLDFHDLLWQTNLALAFGVKKIYYYTYWRFITRTKIDQPDVAIMNEDGSKNIYSETRKNNKYIKNFYKYFDNLNYINSQLLTASNGNPSTDNLESVNLNIIKDYSATAPILINKLELNGKTVYSFFNVRNPQDKVYNEFSFSLNNPVDFNLYKNGKIHKVKKSDKYFLKLYAGECAFILGV